MNDARPIDIGGVVGDAWRLWKADRAVLIAVAGAFLFLPGYAWTLLAPPPLLPADASTAEQFRATAEMLAAHLPLQVVVWLAASWGHATLLALYLDPAAPDVAGAIRRGGRLLPRFVLAAVLVGVATLAGLLVLIVGAVVVSARTMLTAPVLLAEPPTAAAAAVARSVTLSRGQTLPLVALTLMLIAAELFASQPFASLELALRQAHAPNPVAIAVIDAGGAAVTAAVGLASMLVAVAVYRRLTATAASSGT